MNLVHHDFVHPHIVERIRRAALPVRLLLAGLAGIALALPAAATDGASPRELVEDNSARVLGALVERREEFREDPGALHAFIEKELDAIFDTEYSARLVLAQHARGAGPEDVDAFADALSRNLMRRYGDALIDVDPKIDVRVKSETPLRDGAIVRVATEVDRQGGAPVPIDYLFRDTADGWKVFDVVVEGVSYVQTFRTQFAEQLRGKSLAQVTAELREGRLDAAID